MTGVGCITEYCRNQNSSCLGRAHLAAVTRHSPRNGSRLRPVREPIQVNCLQPQCPHLQNGTMQFIVRWWPVPRRYPCSEQETAGKAMLAQGTEGHNTRKGCPARRKPTLWGRPQSQPRAWDITDRLRSGSSGTGLGQWLWVSRGLRSQQGARKDLWQEPAETRPATAGRGQGPAFQGPRPDLGPDLQWTGK